MSKLLPCITMLCLALSFACCNKRTSSRDPRIDQVNNWYSLQKKYWQVSSDSVVKYSTLIDSIAKDLPPVYRAMGVMGKATYHIGNKSALAKKMFLQALDLLKHSDADSLRGRIYNSLGVCYFKQSDYPGALDNYFKALRLFEKQNDVVNIGGVLANIGEVYQVKNDLISAKQYVQRSMDVSKKAGHMASYLDAAQTLANIYGMNNHFDSAIAIDRMGIIAADSLGSKKLKSAFYNNLGNCYMYSNRPDSARYYFTQCVLLDSAAGILGFMADNYLTLGQLAYTQNQFNESQQYYRKAITVSDSLQENKIRSLAWAGLAALYKKEDKLAMAIVAKDSASSIKDRIISEKSETKIAEFKELYETEKKEQTISLQQVKLSRQNLLLSGSAVLLASLLLSAWLLYRRYKIKKEKELQAELMRQREQATLDILQAEDQERRRIAAELHDGVGQVMLAAWMNLQAMEPQMASLEPQQQKALNKAISMVGEGCREVREVSHSMMPKALLNKGLVAAVKDFAQQIDKNVLAINLHTEGIEAEMDDMVETILYRVIQESVNNTIRHSGARELDISIHHSIEGISVLIEDDGKGFDTDLVLHESDTKAGLGLQNIKRRIAFLNGTAEWDSSPGNGTVVTIFIPVNKAA